MDEQIFKVDFEVRDYECDLQGIVNNAVYQNYYEHTRHKFLKSVNLDFNKLHQQGIDAVVYRVEIDFKYSLTSGDSFTCYLKLRKSGNLKYIFDQHIIRHSDEKLCSKATVTTVCVQNGRPVICKEVDDAFREYMSN